MTVPDIAWIGIDAGKLSHHATAITAAASATAIRNRSTSRRRPEQEPLDGGAQLWIALLGRLSHLLPVRPCVEAGRDVPLFRETEPPSDVRGGDGRDGGRLEAALREEELAGRLTP